ncbi:MAG: LytR/AlgR family response regulator transcription factor [Saprospiraceae bacterium]
MKCIIVDDELMARKSLERFCSKIDFLQLVQTCENGREALEVISQQDIDLIFLDVEMPELTGIDLLEKAAALPQVIFITSKTEYAYDAFQYQVTDYLKKPINFLRFQQAVQKAKEVHEQQQADSQTTQKEVYVREDGRLVRLPFADILYFENVGDYIRVKTERNSHIIHGSLKSVAARLNHPQFLKVHRSFIVNLDKIKDIEENTLVIDKKVIPISRANKPLLLNRLNLL